MAGQSKLSPHSDYLKSIHIKNVESGDLPNLMSNALETSLDNAGLLSSSEDDARYMLSTSVKRAEQVTVDGNDFEIDIYYELTEAKSKNIKLAKIIKSTEPIFDAEERDTNKLLGRALFKIFIWGDPTGSLSWVFEESQKDKNFKYAVEYAISKNISSFLDELGAH